MKKILSFLMMGIFLTGCQGRTDGKVNDTQKEEILSKNVQGTEDVGETEGRQGAEEASGRQYTWQEITVTLPQDWEGCYVIVENESGFSIYQKASYNEENPLGYICGFCRTREYLNSGMGETMAAYTDDGTFYYLIQPTDVDCDVSNEAVANEYSKMCRQVEELKDSLQIATSGIHCDAEEYVLPTSSILALDQQMLMNLSDNRLWIARNEIYARHGRQFTNEYLQNYFNQCTWYKETISAEQFDESTLSQIEKDNISLLAAAEQEYDLQHPYPKKYSARESVVEDLSGDGTPDRISYQVTNQENGENQCTITVDGEVYLANELVYMENPFPDVFYVTDILEGDHVLEIAVLDNGPSEDPVTYFFRYEDTLSYIGQVSGFPFAEENGGINGFNGIGGITGRVRMDLIETSFLEGYWWFDGSWIVYQDIGWNNSLPEDGHILFADLPVHFDKNETSPTMVIPAQTKVFCIGSDMYEWILVKGRDGSKGYIHVKDGEIVELNKPAKQVLSDLHYFD